MKISSGPDDLARRAAFATLLSIVLFGASVPASKLLLMRINPWVLAGLLYLGSGIGLAILQWVGRRGRWLPDQAPIRGNDWTWLALTVLAGGVIAPVLLMFGLRATPASGASLLLNLEALATMAIAWAGGRETPSRRVLVGAALILAGSVALSWHGGAPRLGWGGVLIAGACLGWGIDNNLTRRISGADPVRIAMIKGLVAGSVNLTLGLALGGALPVATAIGAAGVTGFIGYGLSLVLFILALRDLGVARASAYFACAPFVGALLSVALLHDPVGAGLVLAGALMGAGVALHLAEQHVHSHSHEPMDHAHPHVHDAHHLHDHGPDDPPGEPHVHAHRHAPLTHTHRHLPDLHHRHRHGASS